MWHSLQSFLPKGHKKFWLKIILVSFAGHFFIMIAGFLNRSGKHIELTVFSKQRPMEIVFVPLYKKVPGVQKRMSSAKVVKKSKNIIKISEPKSITKLAVKKVEIKKPQINKTKILKTIEPKKIEPKPKVVNKKTELKIQEQEVIAKIAEPEKKVVSVVEPVIEEIEINEPIYIGRHDLQNLQIALELEAVIIKNWQPPLGLSNEIECTIELVIDNNGKVANYIVKKSSGVMVYDMSVKRIFNQIVMPSSLWNKTLTIVFKQ